MTICSHVGIIFGTRTQFTGLDLLVDGLELSNGDDETTGEVPINSK